MITPMSDADATKNAAAVAMTAGLADHIWTCEEIVGLLD
jgi:hypothetical protein